MEKIEINDILNEAKEQIKNLAIATASKYKDQAIGAGNELLFRMKDDLARWSQMVVDKKLTKAEFELLVKSYKVEVIVSALHQSGLAEIRSYELAMNMLNVIIDVALKIIDKVVKAIVGNQI